MPTNKTDYMKEYYLKNKDKIKGGATKKILCVCCNKEISSANWNKHIKNRVHLKNQELIKEKKDNNENMQDAIKLLQHYKELLENLKTNSN